MEEQHFSPLAVLKWAVAFAFAQWLDVPIFMRTLIILMFIDYSTGIVVAFMQKKISSEAGFFGLYRKGLILVLLMSAQLFENGLGTNYHLQQWGALAYCANEFISILENCANAGVPIPRPLVEALLKVKQFRFQRASDSELAELRTDEALANERNQHVDPATIKGSKSPDEAEQK